MSEDGGRSYDVALSFAGEDRGYVERVASHLRDSGVRVFYDRYEEATLWGKDLYEHLDDVYQNEAKYVLMFASKHYARKVWPTHERRSAQARALREKGEYVLPARFDDTEIPGLRETVGYIDLRHKTPEELAALVCEKLVRGGVQILTPQAPTHATGFASERPAEANYMSVRVTDQGGHPIQGAHVLLVAANGTYHEGRADQHGETKLAVPKRRLLTVFCAHEACPAHIERDFDPVNDLQLTLPKAEGTGSIICASGTGFVPGLTGRLNPIRDTSNRLYLYADNIAIEGGKPQPARFEIGRSFEVEDNNGQVFDLKIIEVIGRSSLVEFTKR